MAQCRMMPTLPCRAVGIAHGMGTCGRSRSVPLSLSVQVGGAQRLGRAAACILRRVPVSQVSEMNDALKAQPYLTVAQVISTV